MMNDCFSKPVNIFVGLGFPVEIRSAMEAYRYLADCPQNQRDRSYSIARNACEAAIRGEIEAETARGLFTAFAERHYLLAPELDAKTLMGSRGSSARSIGTH